MAGHQKRKTGTENLGKASSSSSSDYYHLKLAFFTSFLAWPFTYFLNNAFVLIDESVRPFWMMAAGFALLAVFTVGTAKASSVTDWLYYGVTLFAFTGMIDLIISIEFSGFIAGFMTEYLKLGERYLLCPYGSAITFFDGTGLYAMYLLMAFQISNGKSWRSTGIYWGAGILNSMIVLLLGVWTGRHAPTFCTYLNIPYVLLPVVALFRAFGQERRPAWNENTKLGSQFKIIDLLLALGFVASIGLTAVKGAAALGSSSDLVLNLVDHEPVLLYYDPAPFSVIQMLTFLYYLIPLQVACLYYQFKNFKPSFLWEMALIQAGACLQAQFSYIYMSLDPQTPAEFRSNLNDLTFWTVNLLIVIVPHLYLYRLSFHRGKSSRNKN